MTERLTSQLLVSALVRRAQQQGGSAMILNKGESMSGTIVVQIVKRGENVGFFERVTALDGTVQLVSCGPQAAVQDTEISQYIERRTRVDPDIWVVELDVAEGEQLAAAILCTG